MRIDVSDISVFGGSVLGFFIVWGYYHLKNLLAHPLNEKEYLLKKSSSPTPFLFSTHQF